MIPLPLIDNDVLIFDLEDVKKLREIGILGTLIGSLAAAPQQNNYLGIPLKLSIYEVLWLIDSHYGELVTISSHSNFENKQGTYYTVPYTDEPTYTSVSKERADQIRSLADPKSYSIFSELREAGYFLLPGMKFGGEFVAYPGDPLRYHSHLIVTSLDSINLHNLIVSGRLATGVKKLYVLSQPVDKTTTKEKKNHTFSVEWAGFG